MLKRDKNRAENTMRPIQFTHQYTDYAEGSVLVEFGNTRVLCNATVEARLPAFLKGSKQGWVTAEYAMLPRATHRRTQRESAKGKQFGRSLEIQRLIGRSLRAVMNLDAIREHTIVVDCDVLQADGSTRCAAISGAFLALVDAVNTMQEQSLIQDNPIYGKVAAVSVGICDGKSILDLDYAEDSRAEVDMNIVMNDALHFVEVQGTAESHAFTQDEFDTLLQLARIGIKQVMEAQENSVHA